MPQPRHAMPWTGLNTKLSSRTETLKIELNVISWMDEASYFVNLRSSIIWRNILRVFREDLRRVSRLSSRRGWGRLQVRWRQHPMRTPDKFHHTYMCSGDVSIINSLARWRSRISCSSILLLEAILRHLTSLDARVSPALISLCCESGGK